MYTIDEAFEILSKNKLTTHKETVRNWVRKGVIQAEPLESRKKGYRISEAALNSLSKKGCLKDGRCIGNRWQGIRGMSSKMRMKLRIMPESI
ncbi:hypothetical protein ABXV15_14440 [Exiguobacterium profundum]|uniref:hypothetical protein n=1 Tax=Exiguobacterium profundum TaxID=307643 RepID=UPI003392BB93